MKLTELSNLFEVFYGTNLELVNLEECPPGDPDAIRFVSRTEKNNGVSAYVRREEVVPNSAMTISVAGGGSVLATFLQEKEYYSGRDLYILRPLKNMSKTELLFYVYAIRANRYRYNYGRQANKTLKDIRVPASPPKDWMEVDVSQVDDLRRGSILNKNFDLDTHKWYPFHLTTLFDITGTRTTSVDALRLYGPGEHPYVTTQSSNNGVEGFYDFYTEEGNVLTVDSAVTGFCAYQEKNFSASDHVEKLVPLFALNRFIGIFISTVINQDRYRYNYGRKASQTRLKDGVVRLPVNKDGTPNWEFMENYIKSLEFSQNLIS